MRILFGILKVLLVVLLGIFVIVMGIYLYYYDEINEMRMLIDGGLFDLRTYYSPTNEHSVTVLIHTRGWFNYYTHIYIIDGVYEENKLPERDYIKFPDSIGVAVEWTDTNKLLVLSDMAPEQNNLSDKEYQIELIVDREKVDASGSVILYSFPENDS